MYEVYFFGIVLGVMGILLFLARKEKLPEGLIDEKESTAALQKPFGRAAVLLWSRIRGRKDRRSRQQQCLTLQKIEALLIFTTAAAALGLLVSLASSGNTLIQGGKITRSSYDGEEQEVTAEVKSGSGTQLGEYEIHVDPRRYTQEQTDALAKKAFAALPSVMCGENSDLEHVNQNLSLVKTLEGYPFRISWESSDYDLIDTDGTVEKIYEGDSAADGDRQDGEGRDQGHADEETGRGEEDDSGKRKAAAAASRTCSLTARLSYNGWHYAREYAVTVIPVVETAVERRNRLIQEAVTSAELAQQSEPELTLPSCVNGMKLVWQEKRENTAVVIFAVVLAAGVINCLLVDRRQREKEESRRKQLGLEYPQLVSKMVLFLGAGMSVRNVFYKLGQDYEEDRAESGVRREASEEILLVCNELSSGVSETAAYGHFGQRCGTRQYTRLTALLVQNLRKGNNELLHVLQEEAQNAAQERRQLARQLGEEAGTKLLVPMVMMLAVTMVIIIIPAFIGFSV